MFSSVLLVVLSAASRAAFESIVLVPPASIAMPT
jgi:hypothetical protein